MSVLQVDYTFIAELQTTLPFGKFPKGPKTIHPNLVFWNIVNYSQMKFDH